VQARPGEDLFRPQRPVDEPANGGHANGVHGTNGVNGIHGMNGINGTNGSARGGAHAMPDPPTISVPPVPALPPEPPPEPPPVPLPQPRPHAPGGQLTPDRPPLPKRRRQHNLAPQLQAEPPTTEWPEEEPFGEDTADQARSRLSAYQRGTMRGRTEPAPDFDRDEHYGERG
jgi:hypothetical protein